MAKTLYEVTVITGEYKNKDGDTKKRYQRIGSVIETKLGPMLKLDSTPIVENGWSGWAYLNEPKDEQNNQSQRARPAQRESFDDVPF
jgi:hypothetical protein